MNRFQKIIKFRKLILIYINLIGAVWSLLMFFSIKEYRKNRDIAGIALFQFRMKFSIMQDK